MSNEFFSRRVLSSPYAVPALHRELHEAGPPTQRIISATRDQVAAWRALPSSQWGVTPGTGELLQRGEVPRSNSVAGRSLPCHLPVDPTAVEAESAKACSRRALS
jgi:hypothetical protein